MRTHKIISIFSAILLVVLVTTSCDEQFDIKEGGTLAAQLYAPPEVPYFLNETTAVVYDVETFENQGVTVSSISAFKQLRTALGNSDKVEIQLSGGTFSQTRDELFADVPVDGQVFTESDLEPGDQWVVSYQMTLGDGSVLPISSARNTLIKFSCKSNIPTAGTWTGITQNFAFGVQGVNTEVELSKIDDAGNYAMTDVSGGFYGVFGFNRDQPGNINDLCNIINLIDAPDAQFSIVTADEPGYWDPATEELLVTWYDNLNDIDEATLHTRN